MVVSSRDRFLNAVPSGGAPLVARLRTFSAAEAGAEPEEATMPAHDRGNGSYAVDCSLKQACDFEVCILVDSLSSGVTFYLVTTPCSKSPEATKYHVRTSSPGLIKHPNASKQVTKECTWSACAALEKRVTTKRVPCR